jgi:TolB-like protein/DNA-binding winged helix-turn-helix (wHTH) protein/tetratricopeptide (TPR) repeat protein
MPDKASPRQLRFGNFELDVAAYELRDGGRPVRLERLAMDLLILLSGRPGQLVTRNEIVEQLWGPDVFVEVDSSVNTLIRKLRRALGDAVDQPRFIQTVQGKGYRFIADVEAVVDGLVPQAPLELVTRPVPAPPEPLGAAVGSSAASPGRVLPHPARRFLGLGALLVIVLVGLVAWARLRPGIEAFPVRVAVMPFDNLSGEPGRDYLAEGLTEETAASLGQIIDPDRVIVIGRMSTRGYKGTGKSPGQIGRELGAEYLVGGSVQAESQRIRVTSNLVRVRDQVQVWANTYDGEPRSLLAMQQGLATAVAQQVRLTVSPDRIGGLAQRQTQNADAYDFYLKGRYFWNQLTPATTKRALEAYGRATKLDPNYALAWSGIADAFTAGPITADVQPTAVRERAREAAERAVSAGPMLAEVQTSTAIQQFFLEWDWGRAEAGFRQAIQIDPSYAMAHRLLGVLLSHSRRHDEARAEMRRARELEPGYVMNHALSAMAEVHAGNLEEAVGHARRALTIDPEFWIAHYHLAQAYEQLGQDDLALAELISTARLSDSNSKALSIRGYVLGKLGRPGEAAEVLNHFAELEKSRYVPPYARALVYAGTGDHAAMFEWLEKALLERDVHLIFLPVDPKWNPFRNNPHFEDILRRCHFKLAATTAGR